MKGQEFGGLSEHDKTYVYIILKSASILVGETFGALALSQEKGNSGYSLQSCSAHAGGICSTREEKAIRRIKTGREEVKSFLFSNDMIMYLWNPKELMKN